MNRGWWDIGRKRAGRVKKVVVDRLEVMQQCYSSTLTVARKCPEPVNLGLHSVTNILRVQNFVDWDLYTIIVKICLT